MTKRLMAVVVTSLLLFSLSIKAECKIIYVSTSGSNTNNGLSWLTAKQSIGSALSIASSTTNDEVWVAAGIYTGQITLKNGVALYGGFSGAEAQRDQRNWNTNRCILDGGQSSSPVVSSPTSATIKTRIDGFTIRNGVRGVVCDGSSPTIVNNVIIQNWATIGAGIYCNNSTAIITNNIIRYNVADTYGGGIYCSGTKIPVVTNNTIIENDAALDGGGIYVLAPTAISNNIVASNSSGVCKSASVTVTLRNNDVYGNTSYNYSGITAGEGDISLDPLIAGDAYPTAHIRLNSPCIDGGWNDASGLLTMDIDGQNRIQHETVDIGADESDGTDPLPSPWMPPTVVRVSPEGDDANDGSSWVLAKRTIKGGLSAASFGGEVWVKAGTYTEYITLKSGVALLGGFAGSETERDERDSVANLTKIEYAKQYIVRTPSSCTRFTSIDGFTICNGDTGISCNGSISITNNVIIGNTRCGINCNKAAAVIQNNTITQNAGFGIASSSSSLIIKNNTVSKNYVSVAGYGGGIACDGGWQEISENIVEDNIGGWTSYNLGTGCGIIVGSNALVTRNTIRGNTAKSEGGGIIVQGTSTITDNIIEANSAVIGGGICVQGGNPVISCNTIRGNSADSGGAIYVRYHSGLVITGNTMVSNQGGGIRCYGTTPVIITNNTIVGNYIAKLATGYYLTEGAAVYLSSSGSILSNNIIAFNYIGIYNQDANNTTTLRNNVVYGNKRGDYLQIAKGTSDICFDPRFIGIEYGDVHLRSDSPCVDCGTNGALGLPATDMDKQDRVQGGMVDIGADEFDGNDHSAGPFTIIRVSPNGNDVNDGSNWANAKRTIKAGIASACSQGGEVWVAAGTYSERINLPSFLHLYGGFVGTETALSERDWKSNESIIDGGGYGPVVTVFATTPVESSCIDGFTIRNGGQAYGTASGVACWNSSTKIANNKIIKNGRWTDFSNGGGGVSCDNSTVEILNNIIAENESQCGAGIYCRSCSVTIAHNVIDDNYSKINPGGGIYCSESVLRIVNNSITSNYAGSGGGIYCDNSSGSIEGNTIADNSASLGGGIGCWSSSTAITSNTISRNNATYGAGIDLLRDSSILSDNIVAENRGDGKGTAIYCRVNSTTAFTNNTIVKNTSPVAGTVYFDDSSAPILSNNIVAFNSSGLLCEVGGTHHLQRNDVFGNEEFNYSGLVAGGGDISNDPLFVDRDESNYHLSIFSPCINMGWNDASGLPLTDLDGESRIQGSTVDIGADECWLKAGLIKDSKRVAEGMLVDLDSLPVTAAFPDYFYIENTDRSSGIRVNRVGHGLSEGSKAHVVGSVKTDSNGERYIYASVADSTGSGSIFPLMLNGRSIGGGVSGFQSGVFGWEWILQLDKTRKLEWLQAAGINNIGLLIKTAGKVTSVGAGFFYLDDGSHLSDGTGNVGVKVYRTVPVVEGEDPIGKFVVVTGISSCEKPGNDPIRVVRTRGAGDVVIVR